MDLSRSDVKVRLLGVAILALGLVILLTPVYVQKSPDLVIIDLPNPWGLPFIVAGLTLILAARLMRTEPVIED